MIRKVYEGGNWEFPFVVYEPNKMENGLPLILQLHGAGEGTPKQVI